MKYVFENNINFFDELYKSLDIEDNEFNVDNDEHLCLITKQILTDKFVKMDCGHKFNYIPLYNDILNHKKKFNSMESSNGALRNDEIRCPYCRHKQKGVLPYYEDLNLSKVNGVNYYDIDMNYNSNYSKCEFVTTNLVFNDQLEESSENKKYLKCYQYGSKIHGENFGDTKNYCYYHKQQIIKTKKKELLKKIKEEKLKLKEEAKQKKKEEKQQLKELIKEAKQKIKKIKKELKQDKTNENNEENVVLGNIVIDSTQEHDLCIQILKTGTSKGTQCCKKVFNEHLCKRHYNLQNK
jgi:hypothetical protein